MSLFLPSGHSPTNKSEMSIPVVATMVILLFLSNKSDEHTVKAFLRHTKRPESKYENNEHFIHLDTDRTIDPKWSHVILDMHSGLIQDPKLEA
jgi:hypothetical protein